MTYNNINIAIRELLDREKIKFITNNNIIEPSYIQTKFENINCLIITAPYEFEAMQLVAEFNKEPIFENITKCYCLIGDAVKEITTEIFKKVYASNFLETSEVDEEFDKNLKNTLLPIYYGLSIQNKTPLYREYIELCKNISNVRKQRAKVAYELSGDEQILKKLNLKYYK